MGLFQAAPPISPLSRLDNCNNSERSSRRFIKTNEAPYQMIGKRTLAATLGYKELNCAHFWLSLLSECLSCYLYVFIVCSTRISWTGAIIGHEPNLLAMSLTSGIAMMLLIFTFRTVHVNPALTISFLFTGRIPIVRAIFYILMHCIGAIAAIAFLYSISIEGHSGALGLDNPHEILSSWQILIVEIVISFVVTLATYATCNYSSYTCAKKLIFEQLSQNSGLLQSSSTCDNLASEHRHSKRSVVPIVPPPLQAKGPMASTYENNSSSDYDYEYDNHRIYATQQLKSDSPQIPIEEVIQDECNLLAPNGFSIHVTSGQALVIGLAYTLTSLCGIPASGASLNPARSFGPAFIMNRWARHWIYWLGPILGAVIAGFFYEFIFNPTRNHSLCYRPKLFRLSAHDMAKVGSKSRLYQHHQQKLSTAALPPATLYRPQIYNQPIQNSPSTRAITSSSNLISNSSLLKPSSRDSQLITISTSVAHQQPSYPLGTNTFDQMNYIQQQQQQLQQKNHFQQQQVIHHPTTNFDRSKSTAMISGTIGTKQQLHSTINLPQRNKDDFDPSPMRSAHCINSQDQVVYDDPNVDFNQFRLQQNGTIQPTALQRRSVIGHNLHQQRFELGLPQVTSQSNLQAFHNNRKQFNDISLVNHKPFNTVHSNVRPHSMAFDSTGFQHSQNHQRQMMFNENRQYHEDKEQLDDDLYNVLSETHENHLTNDSRPASNNGLDYGNINQHTETSDSSQRTSEMLSSQENGDRSQVNMTNSLALSSNITRDHNEYYN